MDNLNNAKEFLGEFGKVSKRSVGASNALQIANSLGQLGSSIGALNDVPSDKLTGQEKTQVDAQKKGAVSSSVVTTMLTIIGTVLCCL